MSTFALTAILIALFVAAVWAYSNQACKQARAFDVRRLYGELERNPNLPFSNEAAVDTDEKIRQRRDLHDVIKMHIDIRALCKEQLASLSPEQIDTHAAVIAQAKRSIAEAMDLIVAEKLQPALQRCRTAVLKLAELTAATKTSAPPAA